MSLGERLRKAERVTIELDRALVDGKDVLGRLVQIAAVRRGGDDAPKPQATPAAERATPPQPARGDAQAVAAAAQAFAERLRHKVHGLAA